MKIQSTLEFLVFRKIFQILYTVYWTTCIYSSRTEVSVCPFISKCGVRHRSELGCFLSVWQWLPSRVETTPSRWGFLAVSCSELSVRARLHCTGTLEPGWRPAWRHRSPRELLTKLGKFCTGEKERQTKLQDDFCVHLLVPFKAVCYVFILCWHSMVSSEPRQCHVGLSNIKICCVLMCFAERDPLFSEPADLDFGKALQGLSGLDSFM